MKTSAVQFEGASRFHLAIYVSDLQKSIGFYNQIFDTVPVKTKCDYAKYEPQSPSVNFTLNVSPEKASGNGRLSHMGIQLQNTDQLSQIRTRLTQNIHTEEEQVNCCYAIQDKFWVRDPDGNEIEFFVVLHKDAEVVKEVCC